MREEFTVHNFGAEPCTGVWISRSSATLPTVRVKEGGSRRAGEFASSAPKLVDGELFTHRDNEAAP